MKIDKFWFGKARKQNVSKFFKLTKEKTILQYGLYEWICDIADIPEELWHGLVEKNMNPIQKNLCVLSVLLLGFDLAWFHFLFDFPFLHIISTTLTYDRAVTTAITNVATIELFLK